MSEQNLDRETRSSRLERLLGDRPGALIVRLVLTSLVVGFVMTMFGLNAQGVVASAVAVLRDAFRDGGEVLRSGGSYVLTGAAIVVPVWLIMRITSRRKR